MDFQAYIDPILGHINNLFFPILQIRVGIILKTLGICEVGEQYIINSGG